MSHWSDALPAERIGETDGIVTWAVSPQIYVQEVTGHLTADAMERALTMIWARRDFREPYGVVHLLDPAMTYDHDMRDFPNRPNIVPAIASAVVTPNALHRMVIAALGIASRLKRGTRVSAHAEVGEAVEHVRRLIEGARAAG